jgi:hypothetical protein
LTALAALGAVLSSPLPLRAELNDIPDLTPADGNGNQFVLDAFDSDQGWILTDFNLQYNGSIKHGGQWSSRFDRHRFAMITGQTASAGYRHRKIQESRSRPEAWFLTVDNGIGDERRRYLFVTADSGNSWKLLRSTELAESGGREEGAISSRRGLVPTTVEGGREPSRPRQREEVVDLSSPMPGDKGGSSSATASGRPDGHPGGTMPLFKILFDLWLDSRPGINPLTFDTFHTLVLLDVSPMRNWRFSAEVSPTPRYYELGYQITPSTEIRGGRIYIPFDEMEPHNLYGGFYNVSKLQEPGSSAFLPDIWTDLGVAIKSELVDRKSFTLEGQAYVVNGFGNQGVDPVGQLGANYPNFSTTALLDNNSDKALGFRLHALIENRIGLGFSFYEGRWTNQSDADRRIIMVGCDGQLRVTSSTELKAGYVYMYVGLPSGVGQSNFVRGGLYVEASQKLFDRLKLILRGGTVQNDSRVIETSDQRLLGAELRYDLGIVNFGVLYNRDFDEVPGKPNYELTALRAMAMF